MKSYTHLSSSCDIISAISNVYPDPKIHINNDSVLLEIDTDDPIVNFLVPALDELGAFVTDVIPDEGIWIATTEEKMYLLENDLL